MERRLRGPQKLQMHNTSKQFNRILTCNPRTLAVPASAAWRNLHGAIWCGAFRANLGRCKQQLSLEDASKEVACPRACQGQPETLTHLFLTCPSSARVWTWISVIWTQLSSSPGPLSAALLMADDQRLWQPTP